MITQKMKIWSRSAGMTLLTLLLAAGPCLAGETYNMVKSNSRVILHGTSSLHDWEMRLESMLCTLSFEEEGNRFTGIESIRFTGNAASLSSDRKLMDKKAHEALRTDEYPEIVFSYLSQAEFFPNGNRFKGTVIGRLTLAGNSRNISVPFQGIFLENGQIKVEGEVSLNMTDFGIDPPTALMGTLKTGDTIRSEFTFFFERRNQKITASKE
ncbi:MAG TPA: YceI family protein [Bacteroidetes bacterium]|nr:YceI family protein [Bacteroidota bacterium]